MRSMRARLIDLAHAPDGLVWASAISTFTFMTRSPPAASRAHDANPDRPQAFQASVRSRVCLE